MSLLDSKVVRLPSSDASIGDEWGSWDAVNPYVSGWTGPSEKAKADALLARDAYRLYATGLLTAARGPDRAYGTASQKSLKHRHYVQCQSFHEV